MCCAAGRMKPSSSRGMHTHMRAAHCARVAVRARQGRVRGGGGTGLSRRRARGRRRPGRWGVGLTRLPGAICHSRLRPAGRVPCNSDRCRRRRPWASGRGCRSRSCCSSCRPDRPAGMQLRQQGSGPGRGRGWVQCPAVQQWLQQHMREGRGHDRLDLRQPLPPGLLALAAAVAVAAAAAPPCGGAPRHKPTSARSQGAGVSVQACRAGRACLCTVHCSASAAPAACRPAASAGPPTRPCAPGHIWRKGAASGMNEVHGGGGGGGGGVREPRALAPVAWEEPGGPLPSPPPS